MRRLLHLLLPKKVPWLQGAQPQGGTLHVQRLRKKLGWQERITAVYKVGYRLEVKE